MKTSPFHGVRSTGAFVKLTTNNRLEFEVLESIIMMEQALYYWV